MIYTKTAVLALALGGAGIVGAGALHYQAHGGLGGHRDPAMMQKFIDFTVNEKLDEIGATEAQKQKVREIKDRLVKDGKALHQDHAALHQELLGLLEQDNPDPARLKALVHERTDAITRFADEAADAAIELHGVFTPEQRKKLLADLKEHMEGGHRF
jgi:periplasmic protein CpxP/Spy